jgi:hypothetical protein
MNPMLNPYMTGMPNMMGGGIGSMGGGMNAFANPYGTNVNPMMGGGGFGGGGMANQFATSIPSMGGGFGNIPG